MSSATVPVTLPVNVWGRLASLAEAKGTTVGALLADQVAALVPAPAPLTPLQELDRELSTARRDGFRIPRRGMSEEDRMWHADQRRRKNLETFRHMTEVWP